MSLGIAFRAFFAALLNRQSAARLAQALKEPASTSGDGAPQVGAKSDSTQAQELPSKIAKAAPLARSEAITLLATLQREARLIDLIFEPLDQFSDAQIGAAAREVLRDSQKTLERLMAVKPLSDVQESNAISIPEQFSPNRVRLVGKSHGGQGTVVHRGWTATQCELPSWQGKSDDALVLAPIEIEVA